jgi:hypothetical protein
MTPETWIIAILAGLVALLVMALFGLVWVGTRRKHG